MNNYCIVKDNLIYLTGFDNLHSKIYIYVNFLKRTLYIENGQGKLGKYKYNCEILENRTIENKELSTLIKKYNLENTEFNYDLKLKKYYLKA